MKKTVFLITLVVLAFSVTLHGQQKPNERKYKLIAYYSSDSASLMKYDYSRITHVIYCFGHVNSGGYFGVSRQKDLSALKGLILLRQKYPHLKMMVALGGWSGCELCSNVFNDPLKTKRFVGSVRDFLETYSLDGFDFDWEYPVVKGYPGHQYMIEDKNNFTKVVALLRKTLPKGKLISFASGGFMEYMEKSIDWKAINPLIDFVNLMSYDLVGGYATITGHMTPLYSTSENEESADKAIGYLEKIRFPLNKVIIGATFYTRSWENVPNINNGLYQPGKFQGSHDYNNYVNTFTEANGYRYFWDEKAQAAFWYNKEKNIFVTGDDKHSLKSKSDYVKNKGLGGLMFWELPLDKPENGLLNAIDINR